MFSLPKDSLKILFPVNVEVPKHLAYVEWFTRFPSRVDENSRMYHIRREVNTDNTLLVSVLPVSLIQGSVHLYPKWGRTVPAEWTGENVLDRARGFLLSNYRNQRTFIKYH